MAVQIIKKFVNLIEFTVLFFFVGLSVYGIIYTYDSKMGNQIKPLYNTQRKSHISVKQVHSSSLQNIRVYEVESNKNNAKESVEKSKLTISNLEK